MSINQDFYNFIKPYLVKLRKRVGNDFVVFGSAPLYLLGVVEFTGQINDLDINLFSEDQVPDDAQVVTFHKDPDQKLFKIFIDDLEVDMGISWSGYGDFLDRIRSNPIIIDGFKFANLSVVEAWKQEMVKRYSRQKDKDYLLKIKEFRKTTYGA